MTTVFDPDELKRAPPAEPRYRLANANVFVNNGFHCIDYLDPVEKVEAQIDDSALREEEIAYIERQLQRNAERFEHQVRSVMRNGDVAGKRVLDIGCGGGLYLTKMRAAGAQVMGVELSVSRAAYAERITDWMLSSAQWKTPSGKNTADHSASSLCGT